MNDDAPGSRPTYVPPAPPQVIGSVAAAKAVFGLGGLLDGEYEYLSEQN